MESEQDRIARRVADFTEAHRRSLTVLATAIQRATGDLEEACLARAWLLFRWARSQPDPRAAAAAAVRRMNAERAMIAAQTSNAARGWQTFPPPRMAS